MTAMTPAADPPQRRFNPLATLVLHFRPRRVAEKTLRFSLTWGLGGMAAVLVSLQLFTGILLKFAYGPVPTQAYESLVRLQEGFLFGQLVRNIHFWSANLLVVVVCLHGLRVFFTGGFHPPRRLNWVVGLSLFILVLASNLTGYLLPWDQLAYWATTICVGMLEYIPVLGSRLQQIVLGGREIGPATLRNFFALYVLMKRKFQASRLESVQAVFVFLAVGWVILTVTCVFFRGQGMKLRWPF
jgi:quinol-cytochrome oxidoreductase complex cytochrome b subunit